jgi:hypothetical protein
MPSRSGQASTALATLTGLPHPQFVVDRVVEHDLRFRPYYGEDQVFHSAGYASADAMPGEYRRTANRVNLDELVAVVTEYAVLGLSACSALGAGGPAGSAFLRLRR